jgi:hypothetical protein
MGVALQGNSSKPSRYLSTIRNGNFPVSSIYFHRKARTFHHAKPETIDRRKERY